MDLVLKGPVGQDLDGRVAVGVLAGLCVGGVELTDAVLVDGEGHGDATIQVRWVSD